MKESLYVSPMIQDFQLSLEGILCSSPAGAGNLNDDSWSLEIVDEIDFDD
jgi:hypothetical protein